MDSVGDLDDVFAYKSVRTVRIRDRRLGLVFYAIQLAIFAYVIAYQIVLRQQYMKEYDVIASARMQLLRPSFNYRWPGGVAPYCNTANGTGFPYTTYIFPTPGYYQYTMNGILAAQGTCAYLDANSSVPDPLEKDAIFLATRTTLTTQIASPSECNASQYTYCDWNSTSNEVFFTADAEMFTLLIDHVMAVPQLGITRTVSQMAGELTDFNGNVINPCDAYAAFGPFSCPTNVVNIGVQGRKDIVPIKTLLQAAGIPSLDVVAGTDDDLSNQTLRYSGLIIVISIEYSNFHADTNDFNSSNIQYRYRVSAVRNAEYKAESAIITDNNNINPLLGSQRTIVNYHGARIVISFSGNVGDFDLQTTLINLTVSLGLLSVAVILMDLIALNICPLRNVYSQYKERKTVDFSDVRKRKGQELTTVIDRFRTEDHLVDPVPAVFEELLGRETAWRSAYVPNNSTGNANNESNTGNGSSLRFLLGGGVSSSNLNVNTIVTSASTTTTTSPTASSSLISGSTTATAINNYNSNVVPNPLSITTNNNKNIPEWGSSSK